MSPRLTHYDLADVALRFKLRETTRADVEALIAEAHDTREALEELAEQFKLTKGAAPAELAREVRDRLEEAENAAADQEKLDLEREAFERGCSVLLRAYRGDERASKLLDREPLANPDELCSMCSPGHADEDGLCPHGHKCPGLWVAAEGQTQTGLVVLLVYAVPLLELLRRIAATVRPAKKPLVSAKRLRNARRAT